MDSNRILKGDLVQGREAVTAVGNKMWRASDEKHKRSI